MTLSDEQVEAMMAIMNAAFDPSFGEAWNAQQLRGGMALPGSGFILIDENGMLMPERSANIAGFALYRHVRDEAELLLIAVHPKTQSRGLGALLIDRLFEEADKLGIAKVYLEMREDNPAASLYSQKGFKPVGRRNDYYRGTDGTTRNAITYLHLLR